MKKTLFLLCVFTTALLFPEEDVLFKDKKLFAHPYQDIIVHNRVVREGSEICDLRYALIKPVLTNYKRPFSVLDLGAAEGYFSFKTAEEFPNAVVVCLEGGVGRLNYDAGLERLNVLCALNSHLKNFVFLRHKMTFQSLQTLQKKEHFDVVFAFLVVHLLAEQMKSGGTMVEKARLCTQEILKLGNDVIIEVSYPDVYPDIALETENLCKKLGGVVLGEVYRWKKKTKEGMGKLYWFHNATSPNVTGIHLDTFLEFNGTYPLPQTLDSLIQGFPSASQREIIIQGKKAAFETPKELRKCN